MAKDWKKRLANEIADKAIETRAEREKDDTAPPERPPTYRGRPPKRQIKRALKMQRP